MTQVKRGTILVILLALAIPLAAFAALRPALAAAQTTSEQPRTLAQAEAAWPGATYLPNGHAQGQGSYLVHLSSGYAHVVISMSVTSVTNASGAAAPESAYALVGCSRGHKSDACGRVANYSCGSQVYFEVDQSWNGVLGSTLYQRVSYHVSVCHNSWDTKQSAGCSGGCIGGGSQGDNCQGCAVVNPWANQHDGIPTYYLRQYVGDDTSWDEWIN
jgi:hypothetical protein